MVARCYEVQALEMMILAALERAIMSKTKNSVVSSLRKGKRLIECFCERWNLMKEALCLSRLRRKTMLKAVRKKKGLLLRYCYYSDVLC